MRVLDFVCGECRKPIVTTFHTLLTGRTRCLGALIQNLAAHSQGIVVMTKVAARTLGRRLRRVGPKVQVIPHGVPEVPFSATTRTRHGWDWRDGG
jgi:hypothetical protein